MGESKVMTKGGKPYTMEELLHIIDSRDKMIDAQCKKIEALESQVKTLTEERDLLLKAFGSERQIRRSPTENLSERINLQDVSDARVRHQNDQVPGYDGVTSTQGGEDFLRHKSRSRSVGGSPVESPRGSKLVSQTSVHGARCHRQRSLRRSEDEVKRSRSQSVAYELSQDLKEKQVEMLERKYGGSIRSRRAAKIIQRAFRQYSMNKNFEKLRIAVGERRLSKRLSELGRSNTLYTDRVVSVDAQCVISEQVHGELKRHSDILAKRTDTDGLRFAENRLRQQMSMDPKLESFNRLSNRDRRKLANLRDRAIDMSDIPINQKIVSDETNNNRNSCPEMNDSSASDSPQPTPVESAVDLHSLDFENLLESKETDILTDSFHSDGIHSDHPDGSLYQGGLSHNKASASSLYSDTSSDTTLENTSYKSALSSYENYRNVYSDSGSIGSHGDIQIKDDSISSDVARTQEQKQMADQTRKYYMNQEVKLRSKNDNAHNANANSSKKPPIPARAPEASPIWKRKNATPNGVTNAKQLEPKRMSNISETSEADSVDGHSYSSPSSENISSENLVTIGDSDVGYQRKVRLSVTAEHGHPVPKSADKQRKRTYRIGLNLFNKKPDKGIQFLCQHGFIDESPAVVAHFLITRKGLSKQMIGEYLGNLQSEFNMEVLHYFTQEIDLAGMQVDTALRKFQTTFRMPGEAQKIERLMESFAQQFCSCNPDQIKFFRNLDSIFLLAFAIIMLNTDLHNTSIKEERKMKLEDFIRNLRDIDDGHDLDHDMLTGIYDRIKAQEFRPGADHVTQVMKVEQTIVGKKPQLALPHRRLVCYCRLYEVHDPNKREKIGLHQREVFLFNDIILVTKIFSKKKTGITYSYKQSFSLCGMQVLLFETQHYPHGVRLTNTLDNKVLITFNARNDHDRQKFVDDLKEAILETNGMDQIRLDDERHKHSANHNTIDRHYANDDSRVLTYDLMKPSDPAINRLSAPECGGLKKLPLSNSLTDLCQAQGMRRGSSGGSLDSGVASGGSGGVNGSGESIPTQTSQSSLHSRGSPAAYPGTRGQKVKKSTISLKKGLPEGTEV